MSQPDFEIGMWGVKFSGTEIGMAVAGFLGSVVSLQFMGPKPWYERLFILFCGTISAQYLTPLVQKFLDFNDAPYAVVFLVGALGMSFMSAAIQLAKNPSELLRILLNRQKP